MDSAMLRNDKQQSNNRLMGDADHHQYADEPLLKSPLRVSEKGQLPEVKRQHDNDEDESLCKQTFDGSPRLSADPLAAFLDHCDLGAVENFLRWGTRVGIFLWLICLAAAYMWTPSQSFEQLEGLELKASVALFLVLLVTNGSRFLPFLLVPVELQVKPSGILFGCFAVQGIALTTLALTIVGPAPILTSPVSKTRVHLVSWVARVALRFIITFFMEGIDIPLEQTQDGSSDLDESGQWVGSSTPRTSWWHASAVALATAAGPLCTLAQDDNALHMMHQVSFLLFGTTYVRLFFRFWQLRHSAKGSTIDSVEAYDRCRLSFRLMLICSLTWTVFELKSKFLSCLFPFDTFWKNEQFLMVTDRVYEGLCTVLYVLMILHINDAVFDEPMRAVRRLEALRAMMSAVWDNSSDIVVLCIPSTTTGFTKAIVSPAFRKLEENYAPSTVKNSKENRNDDDQENRFAVVLEVEVCDQADGSTSFPVHRAFTVDLGKPVTREEAQRIRKSLQEQGRKRNLSDELSLSKKNIAALASLIAKATASDSGGGQATLLSHDMLAKGSDGQEHVVNCEASVTKLESQAVLIVLRDIAERFHRFEAEKDLIREVTERKKDAEANRFIRHEVKNGLLAAISLIENLQGEIKVRAGTEAARDDPVSARASSPLLDESRRRELETSCAELDVTLNEILETILDDAMSRDVVHDRYEPYMQRVDVTEVLSPTKQLTFASRNRFPLILDPNPFPQVILDPRLLRFIHRNAVSNAVRYGSPGGAITTRVSFEDDLLQLQVINLPGEQHDKLVKLSKEATARVFLPGTQLHRELQFDTTEIQQEAPLHSPSAGDGAWIMQKCAESMKGNCSIRFERNQTVFTMQCPVITYMGASQRVAPQTGTFCVPESAFGIVIDDSGIQRKLMDRFLDMIGIRKSKRRILGKDTDEILGLRDNLVELIRASPEATFLLIVDENLDIVDGVRHQTVSGSYLISQIRQSLEPEEESRVLALVRSANDSSEDVAIYKARAHGFICKAPLKKESVVQTIAPLWKERFPSQPQLKRTESSGSDSGLGATDQLTITPTADDLMKTIDSIDALCLVMRTFNALDAMGFRNRKVGSFAEMWPPLREELHKLKGDLKSFSSSPRMDTIMAELDQLNGENTAEELDDRWKSIRVLILSVI